MKQIFILVFITVFCSTVNAQQIKHEKAVPTLDHIAFYVKNLDSSVAFYTKLFQLDTIPQPFKGARVKWFKISPGFQFHLIEGAKQNVDIPEFSHICFSIQNLKDFIETLAQNNVAYFDSFGKKDVVQHRADGVSQIFFQDPNGYWIEVNDAPHR